MDKQILKSQKIILDLCGGTGAWSAPYREAGYDVRVITLPEQDVTDYIPPPDVYGILAAPPCTMFSLARTRAKTPRDFIEGMTPVNACMRIVLQCQPKFWALENPRGFLRKFLGAPALVFKPCEFGDPWAKSTDLWGHFNHPQKLKESVGVPKGGHRESKWHNRPGGGNRTINRAITPPGFANAFFEANP